MTRHEFLNVFSVLQNFGMKLLGRRFELLLSSFEGLLEVWNHRDLLEDVLDLKALLCYLVALLVDLRLEVVAEVSGRLAQLRVRGQFHKLLPAVDIELLMLHLELLKPFELLLLHGFCLQSLHAERFNQIDNFAPQRCHVVEVESLVLDRLRERVCFIV